VTNRFAAISLTALLIGSAAACAPAAAEPSGTIVELETPLAAAQPLQGILRQPAGKDASPAVVLLHGCNGGWRQLDARWGERIARWGYVTLTVDSFGPRGLQNTCTGGPSVDMARDAYRALDFLVKRPFVDRARVAVVGFSQGGGLALTSVERGSIEQTSPNKFRAAIAFYPACRAFKDNMTVPTLILIGERDDWTPASDCRNMVDGRDDFGISRKKGDGIPVKLIVYPDAYHAFDIAALGEGRQYFGYHLEYNQKATDQSTGALHDFLDATIGAKEQDKEPAR
jgi:dienelactone hydrolase